MCVSTNCGFRCNDFEEVIAFARYFNFINCPFKVKGLVIKPEGELIELKRIKNPTNFYEYIMLEF